MKKILPILTLILCIAAGPGISLAGDTGQGPAPNSGDGVADGPGWYDEGEQDPTTPNTDSNSIGPAPTADGISDHSGSGFLCDIFPGLGPCIDPQEE